jgi:transcriptional regulator with XRE-family HTH domain
MGIDKKEFNNIWTAIQKWMRKKHMSSLELAGLTGVSENYIQRGIATKNEWITSEFLHNLMDAFVLTSARQRGIEDTSDVFTDEECIDAITVILDEEN